MSNRGTHPNSHDALKKAAAAKSKNAKQVHITLSPEAIAHATKAAQKLKISRSELFERLARRTEAWLVEVTREPSDGAVELPLYFTFDDWRTQSDGKSIYGTEEDIENNLSIGQFHSGTTYYGVLLADKWAREELLEHIKNGFTPVFYCSAVEDKNFRG